MPQDAYYYFYSEHIDLSYFDHPPMVAYMLKLFSTIFGKSVSILKLADFITTLFSFAGFYYLSTFFLSKTKAFKTAAFYATTLMLTILSINTTPDVPLIFFWTLSLIALYKAVFENKLLFWILSGILIGLTFDSKYTGLFLLFGLVIFLVFSKKHRHFLFSKEILLTIVFFIITISPIFIWNIQNDWISFKFQSSERASSILDFNFTPELFFGNLGTQMMMLIPFLYLGMIYMFYKIGRKIITKRNLPNDKTLFLLSFSIPIIAFFFSLSFFYWVKLNWMMPGYIAAIILVGHYLNKKVLTYQWITSLVLHILLLIQIVFYPFNVTSDDTWYGWEELATEVGELKKSYPDSFIFSNDNYKTSAVLNFYMEKDIYAGNVIGKNALQFSIVHPDLSSLKGRDALFLDSEKRFKNIEKSNEIPDELKAYFEEITELDPIIIRDKKGNPKRKFFIYKCRNYNTK